MRRRPEGYEPESYDGSFPNAKGLSTHQGSFTNIGGDVTYSVGQSSLHPANPMPHHLPERYKSSSNGEFFRNAEGLSINQSTFTNIIGDMIVYSVEQRSLWNQYQWVDFDRQSYRHLHTSSTGVVTMEMEPMALTSRIKVYRIHYYKDREDIFSRHLEFVKSLYFFSFLHYHFTDSDTFRKDKLIGEIYHSFLEPL